MEKCKKNIKGKIFAPIFSLILFSSNFDSFAQETCPKDLIKSFESTQYHEVWEKTTELLLELGAYRKTDTSKILNDQELVSILNKGNYCITCSLPRYNGNGEILTEEKEKDLDKSMVAYFNARGISFIRVVGKYGGVLIANSYIVIDPDFEEMDSLARSFNQFSIIHGSDGIGRMHFLRGESQGKYFLAPTWNEVPDAEDNFTQVELSYTRKFKFTLNFDF